MIVARVGFEHLLQLASHCTALERAERRHRARQIDFDEARRRAFAGVVGVVVLAADVDRRAAAAVGSRQQRRIDSGRQLQIVAKCALPDLRVCRLQITTQSCRATDEPVHERAPAGLGATAIASPCVDIDCPYDRRRLRRREAKVHTSAFWRTSRAESRAARGRRARCRCAPRAAPNQTRSDTSKRELSGGAYKLRCAGAARTHRR